MKNKEQIEKLLNSSCKKIEKAIGVKFRNGQGTQSAKQTLRWVLSDLIELEV